MELLTTIIEAYQNKREREPQRAGKGVYTEKDDAAQSKYASIIRVAFISPMDDSSHRSSKAVTQMRFAI